MLVAHKKIRLMMPLESQRPEPSEASFKGFIQEIYDLLESVRRHLTKMERKIDQSDEEKAQLCDRVASLELTLQGVVHQVDRAADREYLDHPFSNDGQAICNYEDHR